MKHAYLTNKDLLAEIVKCQQTDMRVSDTLAKMLMLMVNRLSLKPNYRNYSFLQDMQADALYQLCKTNNPKPGRNDGRPNALKFDTSYAERTGKQQNPFSYITQIISNSFRRCIKDEGRLAEYRDDTLEECGAVPSHRRQLHNDLNRSSDPLPYKPRFSTGRPRKTTPNKSSS